MPWSQATPMDQKTQFIADYRGEDLLITELCELWVVLGPGDYLRTIFVFRIFDLLEKAKLPVSVEYRNGGDSPTVPAEEMLLDKVVRDAPTIKILADSFLEVLLETCGRDRQGFDL